VVETEQFRPIYYLPWIYRTLLTIPPRISLRAASELFSSRIDQLTQFIYDHGLEPPLMRPDAEQEMTRVLDTLQIPRGAAKGIASHSTINALNSATVQDGDQAISNRFSVPTGAEAAANIVSPPARYPNIQPNFLPPAFDFSLPTAECLDDLYANSLPNVPENIHPESDPYTGVERTSLRAHRHDDGDNDSDTGDEAEREVIEQLSQRIGTLKLASDGHLRFYGPTSNLNLVDVASTSQQRPGPDERSVRHDGQELLNHLRIGQHVEQSLEDHLIKLYFTWQNPSLYIVEPEMFAMARAKWRDESDDTPFYSEVLTNAMYVPSCVRNYAYTSNHLFLFTD
jgi:hypothetical protein